MRFEQEDAELTESGGQGQRTFHRRGTKEHEKFTTQ